MEFYRPTLLDWERHQREGFASGEPSLDEWLRRYVGQSRCGNTAAVWVIVDRGHRVVCYATLSMTSVDRAASPAPLAKGASTQVPALLVGRLATDTRVTGLGLGTQMVKHILATAAELNLKAACRAVVVTALNPAAFMWWQRFGFEPFDSQNSTNPDPYLLTKETSPRPSPNFEKSCSMPRAFDLRVQTEGSQIRILPGGKAETPSERQFLTLPEAVHAICVSSSTASAIAGQRARLGSGTRFGVFADWPAFAALAGRVGAAADLRPRLFVATPTVP